jgi:hypothetical protein
MGVLKNALRYAVLSSQRPSHEKHWRVDSDDARAMTDEAFEAHVTALCAVAHDVRAARSNDGARTHERIKQRVQAREAEWTRRTALDLQRMADLDDRMKLRQAETARRRWFVLGRLLMRAAEEDPHWAHIMRTLISRTPLTVQEQRALGLLPAKAPKT